MNLLDRWDNASTEEVRAMPQELYEDIYTLFEDRNAHTVNLVLQAKRFGTPREIKSAESIQSDHRRIGYLDTGLSGRARELRRQLDAKEMA